MRVVDDRTALYTLIWERQLPRKAAAAIMLQCRRGQSPPLPARGEPHSIRASVNPPLVKAMTRNSMQVSHFDNKAWDPWPTNKVAVWGPQRPHCSLSAGQAWREELGRRHQGRASPASSLPALDCCPRDKQSLGVKSIMTPSL